MSVRPTVRLTEGEGWTRWDISPAQARTLADSELVRVRPDNGCWQLKAKDRVGAVRLGSGGGTLQLSIAPKVEISRLLYFVGHAPERVVWDERPVTADEHPELLPAVAYAFVSAARHALRQGVLHDYREVHDSLPVLRGRLRLADQLRRRPGIPFPFEVTQEDHTADIPENQLLLGAVRRLLRVPGIAPGQRTELIGLAVRLEGVSVPVPGAPLPVWQANRRNQRYRQALGLAELILRGASYELGDGRTVTVDGMLVRFWQLYETFLARALGEAMRQRAGGRAEAPDRSARSRREHQHHYLDVAQRHPLLPDLIHYLPRRGDSVLCPAVIVDAKYKTKQQRDDLYQMLAYCLRLGVSEGHLIYAVGSTSPVEIPAEGRRIRLHRHLVDPALSVPQLRARIDELAEYMLRARSGRLDE
ncbi:restriction endonuclease [Streptomyces diacarni]|uniref:McrC family protein n=1 Tax=Streptomyces diacarni TaxID=2800381 RepID=UPI0033D07025